MIWDLHCHLRGLEGRTPDEMMTNLIRVADRMAIDKMCVYMGYPHDSNPTPEILRKQNDQVLQALSHWHHRAVGFVYLNPEHPQACMDELKRCVRDGPMVGVKLWVAVPMSDARLDPIVDYAQSMKAVIFQHSWYKTGSPHTEGESTPMDVAILARRHPNATIICGHTGGNWELGVRTIRDVKNVSADVAGSDPTAGFTEMAVRELGAERVLYGSDIPGRSFASQLSKVLGADIPEDARKLVLGENLRRLLQPIMTAKGMKA